MVDMVEMGCLATLFGLNAAGFFTDKIPLQVNMTMQALAIIIVGSKKSVQELIKEFKKIHVDKKAASGEGEGIETMSKDDVMKFPLYAGGTLCTLYGLIKYFGKEVVNPLLLSYMALGGSVSIKALLLNLGSMFEELDEKKLFHMKIGFLEIDQDITVLDLISLAISGVMVGIYILTKSWIYNNILAILLSINAIQQIFLGNFKNGFMMLTALFFYDIFFVFGTDVMLTVAKSIDAPIKILFPTDWT